MIETILATGPGEAAAWVLVALLLLAGLRVIFGREVAVRWVEALPAWLASLRGRP